MLLPRPPTAVRYLNDAEWEIVTRVFTPQRLPYRMQILVTNGLGPNGAGMAVPAALIVTIGGGGVGSIGGGLLGGLFFGPIGAAIGAFLGALNGALSGYLGSAGPQGYFLLLGPTGYAGMDKTAFLRRKLVHEVTHVWHGKACWFAMSYIYASLFTQFKAGIGGPYPYKPGAAWSSYNAEQKASLVEDWYAAGESTASSDPRWRYIRDYVRKGIP